MWVWFFCVRLLNFFHGQRRIQISSICLSIDQRRLQFALGIAPVAVFFGGIFQWTTSNARPTLRSLSSLRFCPVFMEYLNMIFIVMNGFAELRPTTSEGERLFVNGSLRCWWNFSHNSFKWMRPIICSSERMLDIYFH